MRVHRYALLLGWDWDLGLGPWDRYETGPPDPSIPGIGPR